MNKKLVLIMAALCLLAFSAPAFAAEADVFSDVPANHWSYQAVKKLTQDGIIVGDAGRFNGDKGLTRYEMAVFVGNAMTKVEKADAEQKKLIDKLGREYNAELTKLGARLAKVEAKSKVNFFFDNRIQYNHTSLKPGDGGSAAPYPLPLGGGDGKVTQKDQFMERIRMYMNVPVGDKWEWNSRLVQAKFNINAASPASDGFRFDRFWLTNKDFLGGTVELGKMMLYPGKGSFYGDTGDVEGLYYTKTMDKTTVRLGTARKAGTGPVAITAPLTTYRSSDLKFAEVTYRPSKTSDIGMYTLKNDLVAVGVNYRDLDLRAINGAVELPGGLALSAEYAKNKADGATYKNKDGYFIALQSKYKATNYMPALYTSMVNPFVEGDSGWGISYRRLESGVSGFGNRGSFSWVPLTTDQDGTWQNSYDGIKAIRFDYVTVPWKNVQLTLTYDRIKPITGDWTNNSFQSTFNFFF